jgi:hypothetical protein
MATTMKRGVGKIPLGMGVVRLGGRRKEEGGRRESGFYSIGRTH